MLLDKKTAIVYGAAGAALQLHPPKKDAPAPTRCSLDLLGAKRERRGAARCGQTP
jgi:hypothetical protein